MRRTFIQITLRDLANKEVRKIEMTTPIDDLYYAGTGLLLLRNDEGLQLFDVQQKRIMAQVKVSKVIIFYYERSHFIGTLCYLVKEYGICCTSIQEIPHFGQSQTRNIVYTAGIHTCKKRSMGKRSSLFIHYKQSYQVLLLMIFFSHFIKICTYRRRLWYYSYSGCSSLFTGNQRECFILFEQRSYTC